MKKFLALLIAAMMLLGMTTVALAADPTPKKVFITKTIYLSNADADTAVYEPNITYTYTVTPANVGTATVTDHAGNTASVKAGDMRAFNKDSLTLVYSTKHSAKNVSAGGIGITKANNFVFDGTAIKAADNTTIVPGVYRYKVTETSNKTPASVGIVRGSNYSDYLLLDVYVDVNGDVIGETFHEGEENGNIDNSNDPNGDGNNDGNDDVTGKTPGFGGGDIPNDPSGDQDQDVDPNAPGGDVTPGGQLTDVTTTVPASMAKQDAYPTYNVKISKTITGTMGDKTHYFNFGAVIDNSVENAAFTTKIASADAAKTTMNATGVFGSATATTGDNYKLKDSETIVLTGIPSLAAGATIKVDEFNDTTSVYTATASYGENAYLKYMDGVEEKNLKDYSLSAGTATATKAISITTEATQTIGFTNKLDSMSPTGVVLRFAPYIAMLVAGAALFIILGIKRRKNDEEA